MSAPEPRPRPLRVSEVPRTTEAAGARAVSQALRRREGLPAAWWGMAMVIASEATLFGAMVASYYHLRFNSAVWPTPGNPEPALVAPIVLTAILVSTSVPVQFAWWAAAAGNVARTRVYLLWALVLQAGYLAYQVHDYADQLRRTPISHDAYSSIYYTLLGADHVHVAVGIALELWLLWKLISGLTTYRANAALAIAWYWHFVNLATVVVTAVLLSARV
jgi:cytochrome c oxidase subunit 3